MKFRIEVIDTVYKTYEVEVPDDIVESEDDFESVENYFFSLEEEELEKSIIEDDDGTRQVDLIEKLEE